MAAGLTPLAVFTFNRPDHVRRVLTTLADCARFDECRLHIFCDGPRVPEQEAAVKGSRQAAREWVARRAATARIVERDRNLGSGGSVVAGITELCQEHGRTIVVEDDLIVSPDFLDYMLRALQRYQDTPDVYQVAGYMFPISHPQHPSSFFLPFINAWGWATWDRAWRAFEMEPVDALQALADPATQRRFDLDDDEMRFSNMLKKRLAGEIDAWDIQWRYAVFKADGLALFPRSSLVWNGGFDGSGINSGRTPKFPQPSLRDVQRARLGTDFEFPDAVAVDEAALGRVKEFMRNRRQLRDRSLVGRVKRGLRRRLAAVGLASNR
jgi:hypothetical protein